MINFKSKELYAFSKPKPRNVVEYKEGPDSAFQYIEAIHEKGKKPPKTRPSYKLYYLPYSFIRLQRALTSRNPEISRSRYSNTPFSNNAVFSGDYDAMLRNVDIGPEDPPLWTMTPKEKEIFWLQYKRQELNRGAWGRKFKVIPPHLKHKRKKYFFRYSRPSRGKLRFLLKRKKEFRTTLRNISKYSKGMTYRKFYRFFRRRVDRRVKSFSLFLEGAYTVHALKLVVTRRKTLRRARRAMQLINLLIGCYLRKGKRQLALRFVKSVLLKLSRTRFYLRNKHIFKTPTGLLLEGINSSKIMFLLRPRRVGSVIHRLPSVVRGFRRSSSMGLKVLLESARARPEKSLSTRFVRELIDLLNKRGSTFKKKEDIYRIGVNNKPFAYLLYKKKRKFKGVLNKIRF